MFLPHPVETECAGAFAAFTRALEACPLALRPLFEARFREAFGDAFFRCWMVWRERHRCGG